MSKDENLGCIFAGRYRVRRSIGAGAQGKVYLAEDLGRGGSHVALKLVTDIVGGERREPADEILRRFRHPRWAVVLDSGKCGPDTWFQTTRYIRGQSLDHVTDAQPVDLVWRLLEDGARVLGALHRQGLIHYDVAPGNWILSDAGDEPHFVLTDGGLAHVGSVKGVARGTPLFMAPEVTEDGEHDHRADLYSLGLVAYRLATGRDPFEGGAGEVLGARRREDAPRASTLRKSLPDELDDLLADLLARDPNARPHDAVALLECIASTTGADVPVFLHEEGIAAAEGGPLVEREAELERFDGTLDMLAERIAAGGGTLANARAKQVKDPVLIVKGAPGMGTTRLADEMYAHARERDVPAVLMSGRETTGDRRGPLRHLVDGMAALGVGPGEPVEEIRLDLGVRKQLGREERSHTITRAVEQFVRGVEKTAKRTPFVLIVQDFPDLPQRAREAVTVLSRHLLSRRENGGSATAPAVAMVVDVGSEEPDSLLVPDARTPERPVCEVPPLTAEGVARIAADRFPGLEPEGTDRERLHKVSEGLPGVVAALLAEGCRRQDVRNESGQWLWDVDRLDEYEIQRGLSPVLADALRSADESLVRLLGYLSLVESPLEESIVHELWAKHSISPMPASPLLRSLPRGDKTYITVSSLAVRRVISAELASTAGDELARALLEPLQRRGEHESALDRARLLIRLREVSAAIELLVSNWPTMPTMGRGAALALVRRTIVDATGHLEDRVTCERIAALMEFGTDAVQLAKLITESRAFGEVDVGSREAIARALQAGREYALALSVADDALQLDQVDDLDRVRISVLRATLLFSLHREPSARASLRVARQARRSGRGRVLRSAKLTSEYLQAVAQSCFLRGEVARAGRVLRLARRHAKGTHSPNLLASVLNSSGIVAQAQDHGERAEAHLRRALRLQHLQGDIEGIVKTTINLGRVQQSSGALVRSISTYQAASGLAQRFGQDVALARALLLLAHAYDQQLNTRLASGTLQRVVQISDRSGLAVEGARAAWDLAPVAAAMGDLQACEAMLLRSAQAARVGVTSYARGAHHLCAALTAMHLGQPKRAGVALARAHRSRQSQFEELRAVTAVLLSMNELLGVRRAPIGLDVGARPARGEPNRHLWRAWTWLARALRTNRPVPVPPLERFAPRYGTRRSAPGRDRRLLTESVLLAASRLSQELADRLLAPLERHLAQTGESRLLARVLAKRSACFSDGCKPAHAQLYSRAVEGLKAPHPSTLRALNAIPVEHALAESQHREQMGDTAHDSATGVQAHHALAHRLLVLHGCTEAPDRRVASALRRVLAATGRMNAGAGLDSLLEGMTGDTIEITGAERACVVLLDANTDFQMRVVQSASARDDGVEMVDLSQTVIQRVIDTQEALLLHDVFDDQELMGRPSITDLSLRSILCVPMLRSETLYGVLYADSSSTAGSFDQVDLEVLSLFAEQAAAGLETHRLVADLQNSMAELRAMQERLVRGERLRTMGELSSGVAHEFNNLLTSILARVQLISLNHLGAELRRDLGLIEKACLDAAEVVRRLQGFTRRQQQADFVSVDMAEVCTDAAEFLRPLWSTRRRHGRPPIGVRLDVEPGLTVNGDPTELREVVTNLLKNGLDALTDGGHITIEAKEEEGIVKVVVQDDGPGIPLEIQQSVFDPFFTTKGERGTGLGLCLCQQIVERHGGEIAVQSAIGQGARFDIELPAVGFDAEDVGGQLAEFAPREPTLRVLVVDDDENVRRPLCRYLERMGYAVSSGTDGEEGLQRALDQEPDVVISDVSMPSIDGLELCRQLRAQRPAMPIILMSGWAAGVDPARAKSAGATALLAKPFALQQVSELLDDLAQERRPQKT